MKQVKVSLRLYWPLLLLADLGAIVIFTTSHSLLMTAAEQLLCWPATWYLSQPFVQKHDEYFMNFGTSPARAAAGAFTVNTAAVMLLCGGFFSLG